MAPEAPISTVYVQNLEERVRAETLVEALWALFSEFGNVIDIIAKKNLKAKGQAFIVFDKAKDAVTAINEVQDFELFGKPMRLAMARTRSDKTVKASGDCNAYAAHKRHRQTEKDKRKALEIAGKEKQTKRGTTGAQENHAPKLSRPSGLKSAGPPTSNVVPDEYLPPNKTLFLQNVPEQYGVEALTAIFGRFEGLREIRLVPGRRGIAFVEYDAEQGAIAAKDNTAGMSLGDKVIRVTYQRQ